MIRRIIPITFCALMLAGVAGQIQAANQVRWQDETVGRLEFPAPTGPNWARERQERGYHFSRPTSNFLGAPKRLLYVHVIQNSYPADMTGWTEQEIADDFRDEEERGMQVMGVQTGMYSFRSLVRGEETRSGRTLHTMKMVTKGGRGVGWRLHRQELYLLFPRDHARTREFYILLIGDFCMKKSCKEGDLSVAELLPILDRLRIHGD